MLLLLAVVALANKNSQIYHKCTLSKIGAIALPFYIAVLAIGLRNGQNKKNRSGVEDSWLG
jgi:hypothetical protein